MSPRLLRLLQDHDWPGNIRQLENLIKRYVVLGSEDSIACALAPGPTGSGPQAPGAVGAPLKQVVRQAMREFERKIILEALQANHWNHRQAARALNISYRALLYKLRQVGALSERSDDAGQATVSTEYAAI